MKWIQCDSWDDLPIGIWLVKINTKQSNEECHIVEVTGVITLIGDLFSWDVENIIAYTAYPKCNN